MNTPNIKEHMKVLASDGKRVGTVDFLRENRIVLTKDDPNANGTHHSIPMAWVTEVGDEAVKLNQPEETVLQNWIGTDGRG